ncbi:hypothetical protein QUF72_01485 [Desulfobacterales bacterium HSG2]|nr:hypothetical protein [Desulfobacterales bacterium HSG2]
MNQDKAIADMSHSIRNLLRTIIDPLENLKQEKVFKPVVVENALRGANLIQEIVNAMNLSSRGSFEDFRYDAHNHADKEKTNLHSILLESLIYSVGNMFDGKHFSKFVKRYFPSKSLFKEAKSEWTQVSQSVSLQEIVPFLEKYCFDADFFFDNAANYMIGDNRDSALKFLILLQELILNAVKYAAFANRENRFLHISFTDTPEQISIKVTNPYDERLNIKTSGIGHVIVRNFSKLLDTEPVINRKNGVYSVEIRFANLWKEE